MKKSSMVRLLALLILLLISLGCSQTKGSKPLTPQQALKSFQVREDFRIELYAAEPNVMDPVELVFDEAGRAFTAEMLDLPDDPPAGKAPRSRIHLLEDTDGDGRIDHSTVFADNLLQVTSMQPWKGGLIVTAAPDIIYLKDLDGDGKADQRKVIFTGFAMVNPESRITNLRYSIDNWIYASNSGQPGNIQFLEQPGAPALSVSGADFRFRLDRGLFEAESGPAQFGLTMDDWGHRFITQNTIHVRNVVIPLRALNRNPFLVAGEPAQDISDHGQPSVPIFPLTKPQHWREVRTKMRQQRYQETNPGRVEYVGGYFSGAAGGTIYRGDQFPEPFRGNLFTGDVSANLVHRDILKPAGVSFIASRAPDEQDREFLASTDPWFRPCNFATGPDGYLYVVDMYREFIETPESIPEELKKDMNFYSGDTMGRIYRILPKNAPPVKKRSFDLGKARAEELVSYLAHPNGWWRLTAQRLLVERQDKSVVPRLRRMVAEGVSPQARLHALYTLEGLSSLDSGLIEIVLQDPEPGVREHGVRLAEGFPNMAAALGRMVEDSSAKVRFQLALSLGEFPGQSTAQSLAKLVAKDGQDRWFRIAVLSSKTGSSLPLLEALLHQGDFFRVDSEERAQFLTELAAIVGARNDNGEVAGFLKILLTTDALSRESWQVSGLTGLARGLELSGVSRMKLPLAESLLPRAFASSSEKLQMAAHEVARHLELRALIASASREALDVKITPDRREVAIRSLRGASFSEARPVLEKLLAMPLEPPLLKAAIRTCGTFEQPEVSPMVLSRWKEYGPVIRNEILDLMLNYRQRIPLLLDALENKRVEPAAFDLARKEKLVRNPDPNIVKRAAQIFHNEDSDREKVMAAYQGIVSLPGDPIKGKTIFDKNCATCHMPKKGARVGPDLSGVSSSTKARLLQSILDPSKAIEPRYTNYIVVTRDGRIHDGIIASETIGVLTLRRAEGEEESLLRSKIAEIRASMVSLMPEGFEKDIAPSDMASLIAYLQGANLSASERKP